MVSRIIYSIIIVSLLTISGCTGGSGSSGTYYGHRYGPDPWLYRGGYGRDRVHVVSDREIEALERIDSASMPEPFEPAPDMGMGDMDMGGMDMGGFD